MKRPSTPGMSPFFIVSNVDQTINDVEPLPNSRRHPFMRWDAYVDAPDPDALAAEFAEHGATFSTPLQDTHDGLRGFEICDPDGYVLFFGRPR